MWTWESKKLIITLQWNMLPALGRGNSHRDILPHLECNVIRVLIVVTIALELGLEERRLIIHRC